MTSFKVYGRVQEFDQANLEARRRTRKRVAIISISSITLVGIIVLLAVVASHKSVVISSSINGSEETNSLSTSIKAVCNATLYPSSCFNSLSPMVNVTQLDPVNLYHLSIQVAMDELSKASRHLEELRTNVADKMSTAALGSCMELLELAVDYLNDSMALSTGLSSSEAIDDLKTWLSAAITYQDTCIDGFDGATSELKAMVLGSLKNSTEFTSNCLAILTELSKFLGSFKLRRLMDYSSDVGSPSWLSSKDRKLLQSADPRRTANVVVAKDGSGKYKTIKAALSAAPKKSGKRFVIYVKKGIYYENVRVEKSKWNIMMVGDGKGATIVSGNLNAVDGTPTFQTATFAVFGKGFMAQDMGFRNSAGPAKNQAVALMADSDKSIFYRCQFDAYQDTLYVHSLRQFFCQCDIYGTVDFIFGNAAAVLQGCSILPRVPIPGQEDTITAQGKVDPNQNTGISIHTSTVKPAGNLASVRVYLGRPWKPYSTTVFIKSMLTNIIDPAGWLPWTGNSAPDTIFYAEYQNFGPGSAAKNRVKWKGLRSLNKQQASKFTVGSFLRGNTWIPRTGVTFNADL